MTDDDKIECPKCGEDMTRFEKVVVEISVYNRYSGDFDEYPFDGGDILETYWKCWECEYKIQEKNGN
jgi:C4-type Zn-finger protein